MTNTVKTVSTYDLLKDIISLPKSFQGKSLEVVISPVKIKQNKSKFFSACGKIHLNADEIMANRELSKN